MSDCSTNAFNASASLRHDASAREAGERGMSCTWDIGGRCNGKTARLIERAAVENLYIITGNQERARIIFKTAQAMGLNILYPISISEAPFKMRGNAYRMTHDGVLVDDVDYILHVVIGMPVIGATATGELVNRGIT